MEQPSPSRGCIEIHVGAVIIRHETVLLVRRGDGPKAGKWTIPEAPLAPGEGLQQACEAMLARQTGMAFRAGRPCYNHDRIVRDEQGTLLVHELTLFLNGAYLSGHPAPGGEVEAVAWVSVEAMESMEIDDEALQLLDALEFLVLEEDE